MSDKEPHFFNKEQQCELIGHRTRISWKEMSFDSNEEDSPIMPTNFTCTDKENCPDYNKCPYAPESLKEFIILQNQASGEFTFIHKPTRKYLVWPEGRKGIWEGSLNG